MNKKLILIIAMLLILLSSSVSAWEWDNVKSFEKGNLKYGKVTVTNALGLGSDLAEYTLLENTDSCLVNCYAIGETKLFSDGVLFSKFEFKDKEDKIVNLNSNQIYIEVDESYIEENKIWEYQCIDVEYKNGTKGKDCENVLLNSENLTKVKRIWKSYDNSKLKAGTYKWKLEGKKIPNDDIDWIGESMGIKFDDWAWWNGDYDYYKQLTITPNIYDVYNGTTINLTMDTATLISAGKMQNDCDDLRIVYNDEIELDRVLGDYDFLTDDGCNDISTNIFFQTIKNITGTNTDYKIYYGESGAVNPPSKADNTFLIYENCSSTGDWVAGGSGITTSGGICSLSGGGHAYKEFNTGYVSLNGSMVSYTAEASAYIHMILSPGTGGGTWDIEPAENIAYAICPEGNSYIVIYNANSGANVEIKKEAQAMDNSHWYSWAARRQGNDWLGYYAGSEITWDTTDNTNSNGQTMRYINVLGNSGSPRSFDELLIFSTPPTRPTLALGAERIENSAPFFIRQDINSTNPTYNLTESDLNGWYNVQDNETSDLYCDIHWLKDNVTQFSFSGIATTNNTEYEITLESENLTIGDAWRYELNCSDGSGENWVNSSEVVILDVIPSIVQSIPENNLFTQSTSIAFECNASIDAGSGFIIDNITLITMNTDGTINSTYFEDVSGADISQDWGETLEEASYNWSCKASSDNGHEVYTGNRTLTIDATSPVIYIAQGLNDSVVYSLPINKSWYFNVSDANLDTCWYYTDEESTNLSVDCNMNISTSWADDGEHHAYYCVNDSIGFEECLSSSFTIYHITTNLTESADPIAEGQGLTLTLYLNMTGLPSTTSATLIWDGINYGNGSKSATTEGYKFSKSFVVPDGTGGETIDYNWSYHIPGFVQYNYTGDTTTVRESNVGLCGGAYNVTILNYTMFDETTRIYDLTNGTIEQDTYLYSWDNSSIFWHHHYSFVNTSTATICVPDGMLNNSDFKLETTTRYWADGHVKEYHYIQNYNQSNYNNPQQINLYSLSEDVATQYLIVFQDKYYLATKGAIIQPYRYYVGDGEYVAVEGGLTDDSGQTVLNLVSEEVTYRFYVRKDGELLFISSEYLAVCTDPLLMCQINLQETTDIEELINFSVPDNLAYVFDFDEDTRTISFEFSTIDGADTSINYSVILLDNYMNDTVCAEDVTSSGQTLTCVIPQTYKNTTYKVNINKDGDFMSNYYVSLSPESFTTFGYTGVFLGVLAYMMIVLMATTSGVIAVVMGIVGLVFISLLGIFSGGSIIGLGSTILWFMVAGVIIIFKISGRRVN